MNPDRSARANRVRALYQCLGAGDVLQGPTRAGGGKTQQVGYLGQAPVFAAFAKVNGFQALVQALLTSCSCTTNWRRLSASTGPKAAG